MDSKAIRAGIQAGLRLENFSVAELLGQFCAEIREQVKLTFKFEGNYQQMHVSFSLDFGLFFCENV